MSSGVTCTLYVDGQRVADGSPGDADLDPTALSGLSFTWGRADTVSQPDASSCQFTLVDQPGGGSFVGAFRTGMPVAVTATGILYADPTTSTITDPSFDATPIGQTPTNIRVSQSHATVQAGPGARQALELVPVDGLVAHGVLIAPDTFSSLPEAWDHIPQTAAAQTWQINVDVYAPPGADVALQPVLIIDPTGAQVVALGDPVSVAGDGAWQTLSTLVVPDRPGAWVGVRLGIYPTGYLWMDVPGVWADYAGGPSWVDLAAVYVDDVEVLAPSEHSIRTVLAFAGRITDLVAGYDDGSGAPLVEVTAIDFTADLENVRVGDTPWAVEPFDTRFARVVALSGLPVDTIIDPGLAGIPLSYQDVDSQPAGGLLKDYAQSVDAVLWSAVHQTTGAYLRVEDPTERPSSLMLSDDVDGIVRIVPAALTVAQPISACDVLRDPVQWTQSVADVTTGADVTWLEQTLNDDGIPDPTERTVTIVDPALEAGYGPRRIALSTLLTTEADADAVALQLLARTSFSGWRASGLTIDDQSVETPDTAAALMLLRLLDGTSRNGLAVLLTDLPAWSPVPGPLPAYLEGGTYSYVDGGWVLELTVSSSTGQGNSVHWDELDPAWAWAEFDPTIGWVDLVGVGPETLEGAAA